MQGLNDFCFKKKKKQKFDLIILEKIENGWWCARIQERIGWVPRFYYYFVFVRIF